MISATVLAAAIWGAVGLLVAVFVYLARSLLRGTGMSAVTGSEVDR
ncbi:MAG: hypothetical protein ABEH90_07475 [Halolamina sp.]